MNNFVVIGAGPAGESAARTAAKAGHVQLIEKENLGGLCLNRGCIPSKTLLSYGKKCFSLRQGLCAKYFSGPKDLRHEFWQEILKEKDRVVLKIKDQLTKTIQHHKIEVQTGNAKFISANEIEVSSPNDKKVLAYNKAVIAVGSIPNIPPPLMEYQKDLLDSDRILNLAELPERWLIVGAGAVGCEYACLLHALGCRVNLVEMVEQVIPGEDPNVSNVLRKSFENRGIKVRLDLVVQSIKKNESAWNIIFSDGSSEIFDQILVCSGRRPNVENLNLNIAGIEYGPKGIMVDEYLSTTNPNIYAIGDVNGLSLLAHAGYAQGEIAAHNALSPNSKKRYDGTLIPRCLYTWPEVASVGMWVNDAKKLGVEVKSQRFFFEASARALAEGEPEGFMQILSEKESGKILGAQMVGPHVTEIIHTIAVAISCGAKRSDLQEVIFAHPTLSEGIKGAIEK